MLSIFPGLDVLGLGFEREGFCVVQGPDVLFGRDVRDFHPPAGVFDGVVGGDPCQAHSALANLVRAKGLETRFGDLSAEYQRVIEEAAPLWFLRENVPRAPAVEPAGYAVASFELDHAWLDAGDGFGQTQSRRRRFWFGLRGAAPRDLRRHLALAVFDLPLVAPAVTGGHDQAAGSERAAERIRALRPAVTGAHVCHARPKGSRGERYSFAEMLELQGLEPELLEHAPFTQEARRRLVGNAVPLPLARALARAVRATLEGEAMRDAS